MHIYGGTDYFLREWIPVVSQNLLLINSVNLGDSSVMLCVSKETSPKMLCLFLDELVICTEILREGTELLRVSLCESRCLLGESLCKYIIAYRRQYVISSANDCGYIPFKSRRMGAPFINPRK